MLHESTSFIRRNLSNSAAPASTLSSPLKKTAEDLDDFLGNVCSFMLCDLDFEPLSLSLSSMPSCDLVSLTNILILCLILKASNQS
ncbi:hypothetical protein Tco_0303753 [Tanacetum coccineum]